MKNGIQKWFTMIMLLAAIAVVSACGGSGGGGGSTPAPGGNNGGGGTPPPATTKDYYPLKLGNKWTYNFHSSSGGYTTNAVITNEITGVNNGEYVIKGTTGNSPTTYAENYYSVSNGATTFSKVIAYDASYGTSYTSTFSPHIIVIPAPTSPGTKVNQTILVTSPTPYTQYYEVTVNGLETVTVPAGTFSNALKITASVTINGTTYISTSWYADGVGLVKVAGISYDYGHELTSYIVH